MTNLEIFLCVACAVQTLLLALHSKDMREYHAVMMRFVAILDRFCVTKEDNK